jgi:hypothetical protein
MPNPASVTWTTQLLRWLCSWTHWFDILSSTTDLALLTWIALMERQSLKLEQLNHNLYRAFFEERTRWYSTRGKKKPPEPPGGAMVDVLVEDETTE